MATTVGPLMSLDASGTVANALTFAKWKGRPYVRSRVIPSNPRSAGQVATRAMLAFLASLWKGKPIVPTSWQAGAQIAKFSPFNEFIRQNMKRWTQFAGPSATYPATESFTPQAPSEVTAVGGVREINGVIAPFDDSDTPSNDALYLGILLFVDKITIVPARNLCVLVRPANLAFPVAYRIPQLSPGAYKVNGAVFSTTGLIGPANATDATATVT